MLLCRVLKPSAATFSTQSLNSVQVSAIRLRLGCINLTCSLRNNTTIPLCSSRACSGYAYNTPRITSLQTDGGREENTNIFTDSFTVEIGQPSHPERAYISDIAQGTFNNTKCSARLSYPVCGNGSIFRLSKLESFVLSSRAKLGSIWPHTTIVPMRTASSTAVQPKHDTGEEGHAASNPKEKHDSSPPPPPPSQGSQGPEPTPQPEEDGKPGKTQQLKKVFKEYGAVGVSFHVAISLMSLGIFYLAVSSGIDMAAILYKVGFSESVVQSKLAAGTSTFVLAYAVHKLFAPVRISITLMCVPLIVRYFRKTGLFKPPASSP